MAIISLPNGIGADLGDALATAEPLLVNGDVWYVDSSNGDDTYDGRDRIKPFATLGQAVTDSSAGDIIVLKDGHAETLTAAIAVNKNLTIVGAGQSDGKPTVKLTNNQAAGEMLTITGSYVQVLNIWFEEQAKTCSEAKISADCTHFRMRGCYLECDGNSGDSALKLAGTVVEIRNTTIISTATALTAQPLAAVLVTGALGSLITDGFVVDGGTVGWSRYHGIDISAATITMMYLEGLSLLRGTDLKALEASGGYINAATVSGGARIDWCDIVAA